MWIFTRVGFFSVTQARGGKKLQVRARVKADLDLLRAKYAPDLSETVANVGTDYPYRGYVTRRDWANAMSRIAMDIDYGNFKNEVAGSQGSARHDLYARVWAVMNDAEWKLGAQARSPSKTSPV